MSLPDQLQMLSFPEWNYTVKGLVEVWELARLLGLESNLEAMLETDDGTLARQLGSVGHDIVTAEVMLRRSALAMTLAHSALVMEVRHNLERQAGMAPERELAVVA